YSSSVISTRSEQVESSHSQMNSVDPESKRCAFSAMRSFTSRNADSVRAFRSGSSMERNNDYGAVVDTWPEPVERVAAVLRAAAGDARVEEFADETPTAGAAARAAGCKRAEIVKSLVFVGDQRPVLALVPGDKR